MVRWLARSLQIAKIGCLGSATKAEFNSNITPRSRVLCLASHSRHLFREVIGAVVRLVCAWEEGYLMSFFFCGRGGKEEKAFIKRVGRFQPMLVEEERLEKPLVLVTRVAN